MECPPYPSTRASNRLFRGACGVLLMVALAQGAAVGVAWRNRAAGPSPIAPAASDPLLPEAVLVKRTADPEAGRLPAPPVAIDPFSADARSLDDPHPEMAQPPGDEPLAPDPAEPVVARPVVIAAPLDVPIKDEACLAFLDEGIYLQSRGDMAGAVSQLRKALALSPEHPRLLYHLAAALDSMSQERKAAEIWRKLRTLGADAGNYYQLAVERFREGGSVAGKQESAGAAAEEEKEGLMQVTGISVERVTGAVSGEVLTIQGAIERKQAELPDVKKLNIKLHLFDEVNSQRIDRTTARQPEIEWLDAPVDWAEGKERFRFEYRQLPLSPDELLKFGQRKYYGYAVELRYGENADFRGNKLEDIAAEPSILADLSQEIPEVPPGPAVPEGGEMFDVNAPGTVSPGPPGQPDAVLFPGDKYQP
jgi:tetratricopeptide (TPR) repeat protein